MGLLHPGHADHFTKGAPGGASGAFGLINEFLDDRVYPFSDSARIPSGLELRRDRKINVLPVGRYPGIDGNHFKVLHDYPSLCHYR
jgi:hypothetical protein